MLQRRLICAPSAGKWPGFPRNTGEIFQISFFRKASSPSIPQSNGYPGFMIETAIQGEALPRIAVEPYPDHLPQKLRSPKPYRLWAILNGSPSSLPMDCALSRYSCASGKFPLRAARIPAEVEGALPAHAVCPAKSVRVNSRSSRSLPSLQQPSVIQYCHNDPASCKPLSTSSISGEASAHSRAVRKLSISASICLNQAACSADQV